MKALVLDNIAVIPIEHKDIDLEKFKLLFEVKRIRDLRDLHSGSAIPIYGNEAILLPPDWGGYVGCIHLILRGGNVYRSICRATENFNIWYKSVIKAQCYKEEYKNFFKADCNLREREYYFDIPVFAWLVAHKSILDGLSVEFENLAKYDLLTMDEKDLHRIAQKQEESLSETL